jgi:hypothetical protein
MFSARAGCRFPLTAARAQRIGFARQSRVACAGLRLRRPFSSEPPRRHGTCAFIFQHPLFLPLSPSPQSPTNRSQESSVVCATEALDQLPDLDVPGVGQANSKAVSILCNRPCGWLQPWMVTCFYDPAAMIRAPTKNDSIPLCFIAGFWYCFIPRY